jgi:hypothetical protein
MRTVTAGDGAVRFGFFSKKHTGGICEACKVNNTLQPPAGQQENFRSYVAVGWLFVWIVTMITSSHTDQASAKGNTPTAFS